MLFIAFVERKPLLVVEQHSLTQYLGVVEVLVKLAQVMSAFPTERQST
jgi:hypothetical protein